MIDTFPGFLKKIKLYTRNLVKDNPKILFGNYMSHLEEATPPTLHSNNDMLDYLKLRGFKDITSKESRFMTRHKNELSKTTLYLKK